MSSYSQNSCDFVQNLYQMFTKNEKNCVFAIKSRDHYSWHQSRLIDSLQTFETSNLWLNVLLVQIKRKNEIIIRFLELSSESDEIARKIATFDISIAMCEMSMKQIIRIEKLLASTTNVKDDVIDEVDCETNDEI